MKRGKYGITQGKINSGTKTLWRFFRDHATALDAIPFRASTADDTYHWLLLLRLKILDESN